MQINPDGRKKDGKKAENHWHIYFNMEKNT